MGSCAGIAGDQVLDEPASNEAILLSISATIAAFVVYGSIDRWKEKVF